MLIRRLFWSIYLAYHVRGQARYGFRPLAAIRRDQARRVRRIVAYAYRHVPYYRDTLDRLGLRPSDFRAADDLARLPVLERDVLQLEPERLLSRAVRPERCWSHTTTGSTGAPIALCRDARALFLSMACSERVRSTLAAVIGRRRGYRQTFIESPWGAGRLAAEFCRRHSLLGRLGPAEHQRLSLTDPPEEAVRRINEFQPDVLLSYGSYLELLFSYVHATGLPIHRPKVVGYGGDALPEPARRLIEHEFGIPVFSGYQALEADRMAYECEAHRGLHINSDMCVVRIADAEGRSLPPGVPGEVIVSNLVNRATVLLNYRLGDVAALLPDPCPCGRSLPLMSFPHGRSDDFIELPSGRLLHPGAVQGAFGDHKAILRYQVVQESPTRLRASVVPAPGADPASLRERLLPKLREAVGGGVECEVRVVSAIATTAAGKHRCVISARARGRAGDAAPAAGPEAR